MNKVKIIKKLFRPLYYSHTGYIMFNLIERLTGYKIEKNRFYKSLGYYPDLKNPKSFNEKILWKKLYDRNPLLPVISDKFKVRDYIKEVLGDDRAEKILIPLLYVTENPKNIPFKDLPEEYVIKPNHASGMIILVENIDNQKRYVIIDANHKATILYDSKKTINEIVNICKDWLSKSYGNYKHEWAYQRIKPKIVIERLLRGSNGKIPIDYKFIIFQGKCHLISAIYDRYIDINMAKYTRDWKYLKVKGHIKQANYRKKPKNLESMIHLAELLGKPFDLIRVDLMCINNQIYFNELTNYPKSGAMYFNPASYDFELGSKWNLVPRYWRL
jgi:hypothetical protein